MHRGVMASGQQELSITVVPGSGTEELQGLEGTVSIRIDPDERHFYVLAGRCPATRARRPRPGDPAAGLPDQMSPPCG